MHIWLYHFSFFLQMAVITYTLGIYIIDTSCCLTLTTVDLGTQEKFIYFCRYQGHKKILRFCGYCLKRKNEASGDPDSHLLLPTMLFNIVDDMFIVVIIKKIARYFDVIATL
jgi:hypothetical protein